MTDELAVIIVLVLCAIAAWLIFGTAAYGIVKLLG
jgi:hypothetical protein